MSSLQQLLARGYSESHIRVRYAETDQMGVVYHANYLVWFEVGRVDFIREAGLDYASMEREEGALIAVVEARARYKAPARYDEQLVVRTTLAGFRSSIVRFHYAVVRMADQTLLCEGETAHIVVGRDMKKRDMPEKYATRFQDLAHSMSKGSKDSGSGDE